MEVLIIMAKIKNIEVKSLNYYPTRRGVSFSGNIYYKNKKVGTFDNNGNGEETNVFIQNPEVRNELFLIAKDYYSKNPIFYSPDYDDRSLLIELIEGELLTLQENENSFKKNLKNGFPITLYLMSHFREEDPYLGTNDCKLPEIIGVKVWNEKVKEKITTIYPYYKNITVYKSLDDFIIE